MSGKESKCFVHAKQTWKHLLRTQIFLKKSEIFICFWENVCSQQCVFVSHSPKDRNGNCVIASYELQCNTWQKYIKNPMVFLLTYTVLIIFMNILQGFQVYVHIQTSHSIYIQSINTEN